MFDEKGNTGAWMIDFTKTFPIPHGKTINHRDEWMLGNCEDGYLFGVDSLIKVRRMYSASRGQQCFSSPKGTTSLYTVHQSFCPSVKT